MRTAVRNSIRTKLPHIMQAVREAEKRLFFTKARDHKDPNHGILVPVAGPRNPWYEGTPIPEVVGYLDKLDLPPYLRFADLGSGLGSVCFAAAAVFNSVTGIEQNVELREQAEDIRRRFNLFSVNFKRDDFMNVPLDSFDVLFLYKPFADDFGTNMKRKLLDTVPGTHIISRQIMPRTLIDRDHFDYLPPLDQWEPTPENPNLPYADFYTFIRK